MGYKLSTRIFMHSEKVYSTIGKATHVYDFFASVVGYEKSVEYFISQLPFEKNQHIRVLDAGCGTGLYSLALLKRFPNAHITAFDLTQELTERFQKKAAEIHQQHRTHVFAADIQSELPQIAGKTFDLVITAGVLEYVPQEKTIQNLSRFLVPGGYFFSVPVRDNAWGKFVCKLYGCKPHPRAQNITAFQNNGFTLHAVLEVPKTPAASFREAHIFKKIVV